MNCLRLKKGVKSYIIYNMALQIKINGKNYEHFQDVELGLVFDSVASTFSFNGYFDPNNEKDRRLFKPFSYYPVEIYENNQLLLTGVILSHVFNSSPTNKLVPVSGYSKPGILDDVSIPTELYPLESLNKSLVEITERLLKPFNLTLVVDDAVAEDAKKLYAKSVAKDSQSIASYIAQLASQRNIIVSHTAKGELLFTRPKKDSSSIATYREGIPSLEFGLSINGQGLHSVVTVQRQSSIGSDSQGDETVSNPLITQFRPLVKEQTKGDASDTPKAAINAIASELKSIVLSIKSDRWTWFNGRVVSIIDVNNYIDIIAPTIYLSKRTNFFVQSVKLSETAAGRTAQLTCVLPETFNGQVPKNIFS